MHEMQLRVSVNYAQRASKSLSIGTALVLAALAVVVAGAAIPVQAQTYTDLHDFNPSVGDPHTFIESHLAQGRDGDFYTESNGGGTGNGTVFKVSPGGTVTVVHSFDGTDGSNAVGGVTLGTDGNLYGNTWSGGTLGNGLVFKITPAGVETALHNFANTGDGANPANVLVQGTGLFYGTTNDSSAETIFKVTPAGVLTTLHTFSSADGQAGGQLFLGSDGNIYGGMNQGGQFGYGTAFKMTTGGTYKVLHNFNNTDGYQAAPGMVQIAPGKFFGATELGGTTGDGVVYSLTSSGTFSVLHNFSSATDGHQVLTPMLASDGNVYGVAVSGGSASCGTIYKVTPAGSFSIVHTFDNTHGCNPQGGYLTQGTDGKLYGLATNGGAHGNGSFFSLDLGIRAFVTLESTSGKVGSKVGILGEGFDSASVVKFNGVTATSTLTDAGYITATVPVGATDGFVTVTTGATTLSSTNTFIVHNSWSTGAPMPTAVIYPAAGYINGKIYVVGGNTMSTGAGAGHVIGNNQVYNTSTNTWSSAAPIPTPVWAASSAVVNGILYVIGGYASSVVNDSVQAYHPTTNTWTTEANMPAALGETAAVVDNGVIYVMGGGLVNGSRANNVEKYNPATNTWTVLAPLLEGKSEPSSGLLGKTIVAADGYTNSGDNADIEGYNVSTNAWSPLKVDPSPRHASCFGVISGKLYVAGGYDSNVSPNAISVTESFNLTSWTTLSTMPKATSFPASAVGNGMVYCFGGEDSFSGNVLNNVQIYQP